jgi:DNA-binding transcriptional regulator YiaG
MQVDESPALGSDGTPRNDDLSSERESLAEMSRLSGELIRRRRKAMGMTQTKLAESVGVTQGAIQKWETGSRLPRDYWRLRLARALDRDVIELFPWANQGAA